MSFTRQVRWPRTLGIALLATGIVSGACDLAASTLAQQTPPSPAAEEPSGPAPPSGPAAPTETPSPETSPVAPSEPPKDFDPRDDIRRSSGLYGEITHVGLRRFLVLITAFVIGTAGAAAFHLGVYAGFIARESRPDLLTFLHTEFLNRTTITAREKQIARLLRVSFWCFGGIVAVVFQAADADSLVPIQAFVLGASWPTVVTQLMSGRNSPLPPQPANISPKTPPSPAGSVLPGIPPDRAGSGGGRSVEVIG